LLVQVVAWQQEFGLELRARVVDFAMNSACASELSGGGASVRVVTGWPTKTKNSSCPAGAHAQQP
jgi:hypothetical protein